LDDLLKRSDEFAIQNVARLARGREPESIVPPV
jgi:hypothetical protein